MWGLKIIARFMHTFGVVMEEERYRKIKRIQRSEKEREREREREIVLQTGKQIKKEEEIKQNCKARRRQ